MATSPSGKEILASLHPKIQATYAEYVADYKARYRFINPPAPETGTGLGVVGLGFICTAMSIAMLYGGEGYRACGALLILPSLYGLVVGSYRIWKQAFPWFGTIRHNLETLNRVFPGLRGTPVERAYTRLFLLVWNQPSLEASTRTTLLEEINGLFSDSLQLETYVTNSTPTQSEYTVMSEITRLAADIQRTTDSMTRQALEQSLALRQSQLQDLKALQTARTRLQAQQEVILTAMASLQTTLERLSIADVQTVVSDLERVQTVTSSVRQQTQAVEQAVQEVVQIGRQG